jgi:hypothetical protein
MVEYEQEDELPIFISTGVRTLVRVVDDEDDESAIFGSLRHRGSRQGSKHPVIKAPHIREHRLVPDEKNSRPKSPRVKIRIEAPIYLYERPVRRFDKSKTQRPNFREDGHGGAWVHWALRVGDVFYEALEHEKDQKLTARSYRVGSVKDRWLDNQRRCKVGYTTLTDDEIAKTGMSGKYENLTFNAYLTMKSCSGIHQRVTP